MMSNNIEALLRRALSIADEYNHEFATYEHLLLSLLEDEEVLKLFKKEKIEVEEVKDKLRTYLSKELKAMASGSAVEVKPTIGFQRIVQRAAVDAQANGISEITGAHILAEFFFEINSYAVHCLKEAALTRQKVLAYLASLSSKNIRPGIGIGDLKNFSAPRENPFVKNRTEEVSADQASSLETYCTNLNEMVSKGKVDHLIGREKEIKRTIEVLSRRKKNNALLVGEPGVGKTAIAEGLAHKIVEGEVPEILKKSFIYALDIGSLVAGTKYRGDFEERIKKVFAEIKSRKDVILFIDEIHTIIGAGSTNSGGLDASNLLKPAFARGEIRCIGATTFKEYHKYFEKDMALARRFQKIVVSEPSEEESVKILSGLKEYYESHHKVKYEDSAIKAAVVLSERYINDRHLPDKAIDLMDEAGARKNVEPKGSGKAKSRTVTAKDIESLVSSIANIPNISNDGDEVKVLKELEGNLKNHIFGQDKAIAELCSGIKLSKAGLKKGNRPTGCYLFVGNPGVGKAELAQKLAEFCNMALLDFDMSEFSDAQSANKLIGSPPGYAGFENGGQLTEGVDKHPYSVVLFDQIENAHPEIVNMILQIMDDGILNDNTGKSINFSHTIIIMTTNLKEEILRKTPIGFGQGKDEESKSSNLQNSFGQEIRDKVDNIIIFNPLNEDMVGKIIDKNLKELATQLLERNVFLSLDKSVKDFLTKAFMDRKNGILSIDRTIDVKIKQKIAEEILFGKLKNGGGKVEIFFSPGSDDLSFKFLNSKEEKKFSLVH